MKQVLVAKVKFELRADIG